MKWAGCGLSPQEKLRFEKLQKQLGSEHELAFIDWQPGTDPTVVDPSIQHVRWGEAIQIPVWKKLTAHSAWTALIGMTDGMALRDGRWWPLCASYEGLSLTFTGMGQGLDIDSSAFISGTGPMARASIAALFKIGYRSFRITASNPADCDSLIAGLRSKLFGAELERVPMNKIVLLAGVSSIFINTVSEDAEPELSQEISYLNFLKRPGAIVDTTLSHKRSKILEEASDSMIPAIDCWQMAARVDSLWAKWVFSKNLDLEAYGQELRQPSATP